MKRSEFLRRAAAGAAVVAIAPSLIAEASQELPVPTKGVKVYPEQFFPVERPLEPMEGSLYWDTDKKAMMLYTKDYWHRLNC